MTAPLLPRHLRVTAGGPDPFCLCACATGDPSAPRPVGSERGDGALQLGIALNDDVRVSSRTLCLEADLKALGIVPPRVSESALPVVATPAILAGQCYALEGSRLGGQVIARQVRRALGSTMPV